MAAPAGFTAVSAPVRVPQLGEAVWADVSGTFTVGIVSQSPPVDPVLNTVPAGGQLGINWTAPSGANTANRGAPTLVTYSTCTFYKPSL